VPSLFANASDRPTQVSATRTTASSCLEQRIYRGTLTLRFVVGPLVGRELSPAFHEFSRAFFLANGTQLRKANLHFASRGAGARPHVRNSYRIDADQSWACRNPGARTPYGGVYLDGCATAWVFLGSRKSEGGPEGKEERLGEKKCRAHSVSPLWAQLLRRRYQHPCSRGLDGAHSAVTGSDSLQESLCAWDTWKHLAVSYLDVCVRTYVRTASLQFASLFHFARTHAKSRFSLCDCTSHATNLPQTRGPSPKDPNAIVDDLYMPCSPGDPEAQEMTLMDVPPEKLATPPVTVVRSAGVDAA